MSKSLGKCLDSCINQTYSNIEIICVDDSSTDDSRQIMELYNNKDNRVKCFYHSKNESLYMTRRTGIMNATGDYILFLDSDDTLRLDACALIHKKINKTHADIIQFGYTEMPKGKCVFSHFYSTSKERIKAYLARENRYSPEVWTKAYSYSIVTQAYDVMEICYVNGAEDMYTSIVLASFAQTFAQLKRPLVNYTVGFGMSTKKEYSYEELITWLESYKTVIQKTRNFIEKYNLEFMDRCTDMEIHILRDFLFCRMPVDFPGELRYKIFSVLPSYFSKNALYSFIDEMIQKTQKHDALINFNGSFLSNTKKMIKVLLLYIGGLYR
jgi:glycosyltransferase involved in cell wall biosynthesis